MTDYMGCNCANCERLPTMTKDVEYMGIVIGWFFCSEECYQKWMRKREAEGKVKLGEKVIFT